MARNKKGTLSKSDFVRQHLHLPVGEIVSKGKAIGVQITPNLVYMVRGRSAVKGGAKAPAVVKPALGSKLAGPSTDAHVAFRRLVVELGVARSRALLDEVARKLAAIVGA